MVPMGTYLAYVNFYASFQSANEKSPDADDDTKYVIFFFGEVIANVWYGWSWSGRHGKGIVLAARYLGFNINNTID